MFADAHDRAPDGGIDVGEAAECIRCVVIGVGDELGAKCGFV